ncbi:hypothetical protein [Capnocytophaga bilenii]
MKGLLNGIRITGDIVFDFFNDTQQRGVISFSLKNTGQTTLIIDDDVREEIAPGQFFFIESNVALVNTAFRIAFKNEAGKTNEAIIRYIVPLE